MRKIKAGGNSMDERQRATLIRNMTDNLPTLRKRMDISQAEFAALIGVSRSTLAAIENQKRPMTWNKHPETLSDRPIIVCIPNKFYRFLHFCPSFHT